MTYSKQPTTNSKRLIVLGTGGMLGNYIHKYTTKNCPYIVVGIDRTKFDVLIDPISSLERQLLEQLDKNTVVLNAIGVIPHAIGAITQPEYYYINSIFPSLIEKLCVNHGACFIHVSTDCVFSGRQGNYTENDLSDVSDIYGLSKYYGEKLLTQSMIIRTSVIGENAKGISLVEWVKSNKNGTIKGYKNCIWNGVTCLQFAKTLEYIITNDIKWVGVRHIFSEKISKYELIKLIVESYQLDITIIESEKEIAEDKSLTTIYPQLLQIPSMIQQIDEMKKFITQA